MNCLTEYWLVRNYHVDIRLTKEEHDAIHEYAEIMGTSNANVFRIALHVIRVIYDPKLSFADVLMKVIDIEKILIEKYGVTKFIDTVSENQESD